MIDAGNLTILLFCVYSVFSVILYNDPGRGANSFGGMEVPLFPLIYLYLMIMLTMKPVFDFDQRKIVSIHRPNMLFIDSIALLFIAASILKIPGDVEQIRTGMALILVDSAGGLDVYNETVAEGVDNLGDGTIANLPAIIANLLTNIVIVILFYYIVSKQRKKLVILTISFILFNVVLSLARAQRGPAVSVLLTLLLTYCSFIRFIPDILKKRIRVLAIITAVLIAIPFIAISHSRFDRSDGGIESSFYAYLGQENLNFAIYAFDNNGIRYGDRVFPVFKRILGFEKVPKNFWERRAKYPHLKINDEVFIGYVGDFVLDFGPFFAVILFLFFTAILSHIIKIRAGTVFFHQLIAFNMLAYVGIVGGMKLFPFADGGALVLMTYILVYLLFWFDANTKRINNHKISLKYEQ